MQIERRHDPYPLTWEVPAALLMLAGIVLVLGVHLGRGLANWFAGAGWHWPTTALFSSLPATLAGDAAAGLAASDRQLAAPSAVLGWIVAIEILLFATCAVLAVFGMRRWGPGRRKGMATAADAETALGLSRLRRVRHIIRPDLYPPRHSAAMPVPGDRP